MTHTTLGNNTRTIAEIRRRKEALEHRVGVLLRDFNLIAFDLDQAAKSLETVNAELSVAELQRSVLPANPMKVGQLVICD
jgi:hypothetical protein